MTVVANGLLVDGSGGAAFRGDVVVDGDRIVDVVRRDDARDVGVARDAASDNSGARGEKTLNDPNRPDRKSVV